ncbi:MAG: hypothetical protein LC785_04570 [Acidobacteria bacterium]|nr:hypothetical protein [Acidobacteriota bacterium]MCA1641257.1 hypothetical protein [Acidobacteriota bacterium]
MKTRNSFSTALTLVALVVGLAAAAAVWNAMPVGALGEVEGRPQFGLVSLAAGQTARLSVVNTRAIDPEDVTAGDGSVRKVTLAFDVYAPAAATDGGGGRAPSCVSKQRFLRRESCEVTLVPGEAASLDFTAPEGARVRAVAYGTPDTRGGSRRADGPNTRGIEDRNIRTTLEVQEGGRTSFVLSPAAVLFGEVDG